MQIVVAGCGKVGSGFARLMSAEGHDIAVVDEQNENFALLGPDFEGITVWGSPIDEDVLLEAGISTAEAFIAATPDDNINTMACQVAKELFRVPKIFARVQDPVREEVLYQFGVPTVCPTNMTIQEFRSLVLGEVASKAYFFDLGVGVDFDYRKVDEEDAGRALSDLSVPRDVMILGLIRKGRILFANENPEMQLDDEVVFVSKL